MRCKLHEALAEEGTTMIMDNGVCDYGDLFEGYAPSVIDGLNKAWIQKQIEKQVGGLTAGKRIELIPLSQDGMRWLRGELPEEENIDPNHPEDAKRLLSQGGKTSTGDPKRTAGLIEITKATKAMLQARDGYKFGHIKGAVNSRNRLLDTARVNNVAIGYPGQPRVASLAPPDEVDYPDPFGDDAI
jgi:hypothetical protein